MIKTIIADDHPMILKGLEMMLSSSKKFDVVAVASNGNELIDAASNKKADLILIDYRMPLLNGIEAIDAIRKKCNTRLVLVTNYADDWLVEKAKKIGADGIVCKSEEESMILMKLYKVIAGEKMFPSKQEIYNRLYEPLKKAYKLTDSETNTIKEINNGLGVKEIAKKNFLSPETVKSHKKSAFEKLGINKMTLLSKLLNRL